MAQPPTLFEAPATRGASRKTDPATSREAARSMSGHVLRDQQRLVLTGLADCCRVRGDGNAWEVWQTLTARGRVVKENVISKRLGELRSLGLVRVAGAPRPGSSHRKQLVFVVTDKGREWLAGEA